MKKQLVLIGGGHAHMMVLANLRSFVDKGVAVTVIQPSPYHYYSGMGPGMLGGTYSPEDIRFATQKVVEEKGGTFVLGKAEHIDTARMVVHLGDGGQEIAYDVLSCNAGSQVPAADLGSGDNVFTSKPIEELLVAKERILALAREKTITVAVVGGGPSAVEIAGNVHQLCRLQGVKQPHIKLFAGRGFMSGKPEKVGQLVRRVLVGKGITIHDGGRVRRLGDGGVVLEDGREFAADVIFAAVGVKPSPIFGRSGLAVGPDGGLRVDRYLRAEGQEAIFGGGDCIHFTPQPLDKVGVYAVRQNPVLLHNLFATLEGRPLKVFEPGGTYLLIYNLGDGDGVLAKWSLTFSGKLAFTIKDWIDRRFITNFQE
jgi:NADH dehydrogenase FAD-containing subunit